MTDFISNRETLERADEVFGTELQHDLSIEEAAELILAIVRGRRDRAAVHDLIEEAADVRLLCDQLAVSTGMERMYEEMYDTKVARLERRIDDATDGGEPFGRD